MEKGKDGTGRFEGVRVAKSSAQTPRLGTIADACRLAGVQTPTPVWASQEKHWSSLLTRLNDFDSSLTR